MKILRPGFIVGFVAGYVLGAKAGRQRYEEIRQLWGQLVGSPTVHRAAEMTRGAAAEGAKRGLTVVQHGVERAGSAVKDRLHRGEDATQTVIDEVEGQSGRPPDASPSHIRDAFAQGEVGT